MTRILRNLIKLFIVSLLFVSCANDAVYFKYKSINESGWNKDSICTFDVAIENESLRYNVYINTRNRGEYPYQNLWLFIKTTSPDSVVTNDTIEFYLADEFGKWLGNGVGSVFNMPVLYQQNFKFPKKGVYHFDIQHGMRDSLLSGINNVGIKVEKAN